MINLDLDTKCRIDYSNKFKKQLKKLLKQDIDVELFLEVITKLANKEELDKKHKNHKLTNDKYHKDCYECHITPDWLLIYKYINNELVLLLIGTGSHSDLFK